MPNIRTFRNLIAWQKGTALAQEIYKATASMLSSEQFGLTNQMRRAAVSVPSNIAEGHGRRNRPDYLKHLRIARGSLAELTTQFELATSLRLLAASPVVSDLLAEQDRILQALIRSLEIKGRQ
jgi:four helix bundle protein